MTEMIEHRVIVWDKPQVITVYPKSKSVWIAVGDYMGKPLEVKGRSERSAIRLWQDAARLQGQFS